MSEKKQIKISDVVALLQEGKTRKEIAEHYDIPQSSVKKIFQHPKLKGKKSHKTPDYELVDDVSEDGTVITEDTPVNAENWDANVEEAVA